MGGGGGIPVVVVDDDDDDEDEDEALVDVENWLNVVWNCCWFAFVVDVDEDDGDGCWDEVGCEGGGCGWEEVWFCWINKRVKGKCRFLTIKSTSSCFSVHVWDAIFFACKNDRKFLTFNANSCSSVVESLDINWQMRQIRCGWL